MKQYGVVVRVELSGRAVGPEGRVRPPLSLTEIDTKGEGLPDALTRTFLLVTLEVYDFAHVSH